jgi:hypothetical protein
MLFYPDVFLLLFVASLVYAEFYAVLTIYSTLLRSEYHYDEIVIGLSYLWVLPSEERQSTSLSTLIP